MQSRRPCNPSRCSRKTASTFADKLQQGASLPLQRSFSTHRWASGLLSPHIPPLFTQQPRCQVTLMATNISSILTAPTETTEAAPKAGWQHRMQKKRLPTTAGQSSACTESTLLPPKPTLLSTGTSLSVGERGAEAGKGARNSCLCLQLE